MRNGFGLAVLVFGALAACSMMVIDVPAPATSDYAVTPSVSLSTAYAHHPCCCEYDDGSRAVVDHEDCEKDAGVCVDMDACEANTDEKLSERLVRLSRPD